MTRDNVMSTPIFDELLREMAQRAEPHVPTTADQERESAVVEPVKPPSRRRHRAE